MMNPAYYFDRMVDLISEFKPSPSRTVAEQKLEELKFWLSKCQVTEEARTRDLTTRAPTYSQGINHKPGECGGPGICVVCTREST